MQHEFKIGYEDWKKTEYLTNWKRYLERLIQSLLKWGSLEYLVWYLNFGTKTCWTRFCKPMFLCLVFYSLFMLSNDMSSVEK